MEFFDGSCDKSPLSLSRERRIFDGIIKEWFDSCIRGQNRGVKEGSSFDGSGVDGKKNTRHLRKLGNHIVVDRL
jgi:hypothetical protein